MTHDMPDDDDDDDVAELPAYPAAVWAWGSIRCLLCFHAGQVVVEESPGVPRLGGIECAACRCRACIWTHRGGIARSAGRARDLARTLS